MKQLDELIRGEMAAVKSFDLILPKLTNGVERGEFASIRLDHIKAIDTLKKFANINLSENFERPGPWGTFSEAFAGGASLFGEKSAIKALKVGEEFGIKEYREALSEEGIDSELKEVIETQLIPNQMRHISAISRYLQ